MATEDVYATLLTNDRYLPGAMVLSHALRDGGVRDGVAVPGTTKKLAVLVAENRLNRQSLDELALRFDYIIQVPIITGTAPDNLALLGRPELNETFTKIQLWKQTQFRKIVYLDADVLPIAPPDELFDIDAPFSASPDIGWPDCFNSGVFVLTPNLQTYEGLLQLAASGQSFDGADQGLLNTYFSNWHRLPFTYNCTPSASYQYTPAYRHFGSKVSVVHFIGASKPWDNRATTTHAGGPFGEHVKTWWKVWDKHYVPQGEGTAANLTQYRPPAALPTGTRAGGAAEEAPAQWAPPPKVTEAKQTQTAVSSHPAQAHVGKGTSAVDTQEDRSATPTPTSTQEQEDRAPTPTPATIQDTVTAAPADTVPPPYVPAALQAEVKAQVEVGDKPVTTVTIQPDIVPHRPVATRTFPAQVAPYGQEVKIPTRQTPAALLEEPHPRPLSPVNPISLPEFDDYRAYQPTFVVAGTVYVHRSDEWNEEDYNAYEKAYPVSSAPGYKEPFKAPLHTWDPARSPPPANSAPEASNLPFQIMYRNEWDLISESLRTKRTKEQEEAPAVLPSGLKPVFPWETRAPAPTRVFDAPIERPFSPEAESETDDASTVSYDEPESEFSDAEEEGHSWAAYRRNQWDHVPGIPKYVSTFQNNARSKPDSLKFKQQKPIRPAEIDGVPVTGGRRTNRTSSVRNLPGAPGLPPQDQWDPNAKLDDLRTLPVSFLQRQARNLRQNQQWYNPRDSSYGDPMIPWRLRASKGMRADGPQMLDRSTQWERRPGWTADVGTQTAEREQE